MPYRRILAAAGEIKPAIVGTLGTTATAVLDSINVAIGIAVGLATLVYLIIRIRKELRK